ncbi:MAG: hypothetical protein UX79_C0011G0007 [candidate division WWE3 bacterium GW2011_GWB1_47_11]|uniref:UPF0102 protein UX79_C0011G0007 n=3 Tax=Katanobacteria TaxID=422282 RepID=A0A0G1TTE3_UNCKA|nr:MAG: hypothetical protein UX69_C0017G0007 [candidate division WWE3 bacterium GW2011_GWA2_46_9]KKU50937.1 MAG: hypothetical protein UX73_C0011G0007 [candidate division WWE3 bacterium GW2011_GWC1_47_10]KKU57443.1 MAG: hypothetical protein UX79_C0011G0007 [candidate division WWE3 bacterium GW2011_GWB1_47_11]
MTNVKKGKFGEEIARNFLRSKGYIPLYSNWYCRWGELDLVCKYYDTLVFVEVKYRTSLNHGAPYDAITSRKKKNLLRTINYFLLQHKLFDTSYRLDVVGVVKVTGGVEINHYESITA